MKKRRDNLIAISMVTLVGIAILFVFFPIENITFGNEIIPSESSRPKYCLEGICADESVFEDLPPYPDNFGEVHTLMYPEPYLGMVEDFSVHYPDEHYWKQPEFYGNSFVEQGLQYYTTRQNVAFSAGSGPYPGDMVMQTPNINDTYRTVTYWRSGLAVYKYQLFKLDINYPESSTIRMGEITVTQDPERAKECIDVEVSPRNIFLEPTKPKYRYDWTQKVEANVTVKCNGNWVVQLQPGDPDVEVERQYIREYGASSVSMQRSGGVWQIFILAE